MMMKIDYKDLPGYRKRSFRLKRKRVVRLIILAGLLYLAFDLWNGFQLRRGRELLLKGEFSAAQKKFTQVEKMRIRRKEAYEALGISRLMEGDYREAEPLFSSAATRRVKRSVFDYQPVFSSLLDKGDYQAAQIYGEYLKRYRSELELNYYLGVAYNGLNQLDRAEELFQLANQVPRLRARIDAHMSLLQQKRDTDRSYYLYDRKGEPIAGLRISDGLRISLNEEFSSILGSFPSDSGVERYLTSKDRWNKVYLTLDREIQKAAYEAFKGYRGSLVVVKPTTGEVLAVVNSPPSSENIAFERYYEPGSIIKMITLAACLEANVDFSAFFPFNCQKPLRLEGRLVYDWMAHGEVRDIEEALAVSCNLTFARLGLTLGRETLMQELKMFGFDMKLDSPFIPVNLGEILKEEELPVVNLSIGLHPLRITPIHAALIAAAIGNQGICMKPFLLKTKKNIEDKVFWEQMPKPLFSVASREVAEKLSWLMTEVVDNPRGTGKRAKIEGLTFGLKTGTAGEKSKGLNAILIGLAPIPRPRIAFAIFAEGEGRAELAGAAITKKLLELTKDRLREIS
ncbi:MAG: penicillin-binding transpeptidase domain-containing protein [Acidobacteriota bacterium]